MTRSRSLDDMLSLSNQKTTKRRTIKRKVGGSKFYTTDFLKELEIGKEGYQMSLINHASFANYDIMVLFQSQENALKYQNQLANLSQV